MLKEFDVSKVSWYMCFRLNGRKATIRNMSHVRKSQAQRVGCSSCVIQGKGRNELRIVRGWKSRGFGLYVLVIICAG